MRRIRRIGILYLAVVLMLGTLPHGAQAMERAGFDDVRDTMWFYDAVDWASSHGIATGTGEKLFSPDEVCSRGQIVTFLWRMAGAPESSDPLPAAYSDLQTDAYYYDAMVWAVEEGIITGTSSTTISPDDACTRAQAVTMLWRYAGASDDNTTYFVDVPESAYYYHAVAWASSRYVTDGTSLLEFSPDHPCTRAQIVTMLYRMQRTGIEALRSRDIQSMRVENILEDTERMLTETEITRFQEILTRAALYENLKPDMEQGQTSDPQYIVYIEYQDGSEDIFYSVETGAIILYKHTGTVGAGGEGYIAIRSEEMQQFFEDMEYK